MRINNYHKNSKKIVAILATVAVILGVLFCAYWFFVRDKGDSNQQGPAKTSETTDNDPAVDTPARTPDENGNKTPVQNEPTDNLPASDNSISGYFTYKSVNDGVLTLRVQINELLSGGSCSLTMTNSGNSLTRQAQIIDSASTASCNGFDIPVNNLSAGKWSVRIDVTSGNRAGTITEEVTI